MSARGGRPGRPRGRGAPGEGPGGGLRVIAGALKGRLVPSPRGPLVRPLPARGRESLFSRLQFDLPGAAVADLFAGTGLFGIEALSRGAARALFVELDRGNAAALSATLAAFGVAPRAEVVAGDALEAVARLDGVRILFADPPFHRGLLERLAERLAAAAPRLHPACIVALKHEAALDPPLLPGFTAPTTRRFASVAFTLYHRLADPPADPAAGEAAR